MRTHRKYTPFICWTDASLVTSTVTPQALAAARLEGVDRGGCAGVSLDLVFLRDDRIAVVPLIEVLPEMLEEREASPIVWPAAVGELVPCELAVSIEARVLPWIESQTLAREFSGEALRVYDESARGLLKCAREDGFLGIAPYRSALRDAAAYADAARYVGDASVWAQDTRGSAGAAILHRHCSRVRIDLGSEERNGRARRWFGIDAFGTSEGCGVRIVAEAGQEHSGTIDPAAPPHRKYRIEPQPERSVRPSIMPFAPAAGGGSAGRVLFVLRDDFEFAPDADTDEALALAGLLRAEGFHVEMRAASLGQPSDCDLLHLFGVSNAREYRSTIDEARARKIPIVMTAALPACAADAAWGTGIVPAMLRMAHDEMELEEYLGLLALRRIEAPGCAPNQPEPFAGYEQTVRTALSACHAVLCSNAEEEARLRALGYAGPLVRTAPALYRDGNAAHPAPIPARDYVLVHAPIEPRCNQLLVLCAARASRLPVVFAGPVCDREYALALREFASENVWFTESPDRATVDALYRGARVYADFAWGRHGEARLARAATAGCALAVSGPASICERWQGAVCTADPASVTQVRQALNEAWSRGAARGAGLTPDAARAAAVCEPRGALVTVARAYAHAQHGATSV